MLSTFLGAATFQNGSISIEPNSRNLIIFTDSSNINDNSISIRGPYTVDTAIENESNVIRMPADAMMTLGIKVNDTIILNGESYLINGTRDFERDILRLPIDVKNTLNLEDGDTIQNSRLIDVFARSSVNHPFSANNTTFVEKFVLSSRQENEWVYNVIVDNVTVATSFGAFNENQSYLILADGSYLGEFTYYNESSMHNLNLTYKNHDIQIIFNNTNTTTVKKFDNEFINFGFNN